ncbi:MAG: restriction endonuclease [Alphaproteobacteria bacterium]|nr:MAG: restriction endonuclease [Alphaproteobacteria bacterium]
MTIWVVRAGRKGEREDKALKDNLSFIGWGEMPDLAKFKTKDDLKRTLAEVYSNNKSGRINNHANQIWAFLSGIKIGDTIALPLKNQPAIAFGKVVGDYFYKADNPEDMRHCRKVEWLPEPILRSKFDSDLKYSFGAIQTVFKVDRNDAEARIKRMITRPNTKDKIPDSNKDIPSESGLGLYDLAADQLSDFIGRKFRGRNMEKLVEAVLKAKGYETDLCPEGADGGVDILAARGVMGFEHPRICVQVKSGDGAVGREILDQLQGVMQKFKADHGLLVSWGGFKPTVIEEARRNFFQIRLWNDQKLVQEIQEVYEKLPSEIQAEIPLQRSWILVDEE